MADDRALAYAEAHPKAWAKLVSRYEETAPGRKIRSATGIPAVELRLEVF